jgi:hypothetical protein
MFFILSIFNSFTFVTGKCPINEQQKIGRIRSNDAIAALSKTPQANRIHGPLAHCLFSGLPGPIQPPSHEPRKGTLITPTSCIHTRSRRVTISGILHRGNWMCRLPLGAPFSRPSGVVQRLGSGGGSDSELIDELRIHFIHHIKQVLYFL